MRRSARGGRTGPVAVRQRDSDAADTVRSAPSRRRPPAATRPDYILLPGPDRDPRAAAAALRAEQRVPRAGGDGRRRARLPAHGDEERHRQRRRHDRHAASGPTTGSGRRRSRRRSPRSWVGRRHCRVDRDGRDGLGDCVQVRRTDELTATATTTQRPSAPVVQVIGPVLDIEFAPGAAAGDLQRADRRGRHAADRR